MRINLKHWWDATSLANRLVAMVAALSLVVTIGGLALSLIARSEREWLIAQVASQDNGTALQAIERLRVHGWLHDEDSLRGAKLIGANLAGADLTGVALQNTWLMGANLQGVRGLSDEELVSAGTLWGATMPDGSRYDGRYRLAIDGQLTVAHGVDPNDPAAMAAFFGVPLAEYQRGQAWAEEQLESVREEAGAGTGVSSVAGPVEPGGIAVLTSVVVSFSVAYLLFQTLPTSYQREVDDNGA